MPFSYLQTCQIKTTPWPGPYKYAKDECMKSFFYEDAEWSTSSVGRSPNGH
jgi:hypothetical protein